MNTFPVTTGEFEYIINLDQVCYFSYAPGQSVITIFMTGGHKLDLKPGAANEARALYEHLDAHIRSLRSTSSGAD